MIAAPFGTSRGGAGHCRPGAGVGRIRTLPRCNASSSAPAAVAASRQTTFSRTPAAAVPAPRPQRLLAGPSRAAQPGHCSLITR